jgi:hypothetical protein
MFNRNIRKKSGYSWSESTHTGFGERSTRGFSVDNLDTKDLNSAENAYEKLFILVRGVLEENSSYCMDNEEERLQTCQDIADKVRPYLKSFSQK